MPRVRAQTMARVSVTDTSPARGQRPGSSHRARRRFFDVERAIAAGAEAVAWPTLAYQRPLIAVEERRVPLEGAIEPCALLLGTRPRRIQHGHVDFPDSSPAGSRTTAPDTFCTRYVCSVVADGSASSARRAPTLRQPPREARQTRLEDGTVHGFWRIARVGGEMRRGCAPDLESPESGLRCRRKSPDERSAPRRRGEGGSEALLAYVHGSATNPDATATRAGNTLLGA